MSGEDENEEIVDATVVGDEGSTPAVPAETHAAAAPSSALVRRERRSEVLRPLDSSKLLESFAEYQQLLQRLLTDDDWQGKPGAPGSFVKKKGWRKIATAFDLDVQIVRSEVGRDENGKPLRAEVWARAVAPSGRAMDGDGYCAADEPRFRSASGSQKIENDLRATATTRAMNRAISGLVGMGAVSAEETDGAPAAAASNPLPYGKPAAKKQVEAARNALGYLMDQHPNDPIVDGLLHAIGERASAGHEGVEPYVPQFTLASITLVAVMLKQARAAKDADGADPAQETAEEREERERGERLAAEHGEKA